MAFARMTKTEARAALQLLVERYMSQRAAFERVEYLESQVRVDFIDDFLRVFGWDVSNQDGHPMAQRSVVVELSTDLPDDRLGRPDYVLRHRAEPAVTARSRFPVEVKKPHINLSTAPGPAQQARSYGWSMNLPVAVLTNFRETSFFDATIEVEATDGASVALIPGKRFLCADYVERFDELWELMSFEMVEQGRYNEVYEYVEPPRGQAPFDQRFLSQLRTWRLKLGGDIALLNPGLPDEEVARRVQRLLNALLFLRVCEDRSIDDYQALLRAAQDDEVVEAFRVADQVFNARLFEVLDNTTVTTSVLRDLIEALYWPKSPYAFGAVSPAILAAVYEQFLSERLVVEPDRTVRIVWKPEVTHSGGIVPTPQFIVDELIRRSLTERLAVAESVEEARQIRFLDLSVGSGVFLITAYEVLLSWIEERTGPVNLAGRLDIVRDQLFGVDIDPEAVEVTRFSLLLAVLGQHLVDRQTDRHLLPDLTQNVVVGNSVIDRTGFLVRFPELAHSIDTMTRIKPFSWSDNLPSSDPATGGRGFDLIVGNPPYARIQVLASYLPEQLVYLQDPHCEWESGKELNFDLSSIFVERGLALLAPQGRLAMVIPNRFIKTTASAALRKKLAPKVVQLTDFGSQQVFPGRQTYTCLLTAEKDVEDNVPLLLEVVHDLAAWQEGIRAEPVLIERSTLSEAPWMLDDDAERLALVNELMLRHPKRLHEVAEIFVGVQTSNDKLYFVSPTSVDEDTVEFVDLDGETRTIEAGICRPALLDQKLLQYDKNPVPDVLAIFPYEFEPYGAGQRAVPMSRQLLEDQFPLALAYFEAHAEKLRARAMTLPAAVADRFWAYGRSQSLTKLDGPKLIIKVLALIPRYALDTNGLVVAGGGNAGPFQCVRPRAAWTHSIETLTALLSHPFIDQIVALNAQEFRGGYFSHRKQTLEDLPVPEITREQDAEITRLVRALQDARMEQADEADEMRHVQRAALLATLQGSIDAIIGAALGLPG